INVGGTATIKGGSVQVLEQNGKYAPKTTYTILSAADGLSGAYSGVRFPGNFAFLTYSLAYDANNVFLNRFQSFAAGAQTANQRAVGSALDRAGVGAVAMAAADARAAARAAVDAAAKAAADAAA